jgi:hypothetical protein
MKFSTISLPGILGDGNPIAAPVEVPVAIATKIVSTYIPPADCIGTYNAYGEQYDAEYYYEREGGGYILWFNSDTNHWMISVAPGQMEIDTAWWISPAEGRDGIDAFYLPGGTGSGYAVVS